MNSTYDYPLSNNYMWFKMILESFRDQSSKDNATGYFTHQFSVRNDVFEPYFFFALSKEHAVSLKEAFEKILSNNNNLPDFSSSIIDQVYKCEFVFGYDPSVEFAILFEDRKQLIELSDFDNMISAIDRLILKNSALKSVKSTNTKQHSFRYKKYDTAPLNINKLYKELKSKNFIHPDTRLVNFKKVFSGGEIIKPIIWIGTMTELGYFVKQLHDKLKYVENLKHQKWPVAINCFIQGDGTQFERTPLRSQVIPSTSRIIDSLLEELK
jgi:hypothetical protein